ncbi:MAG TPA: DUF4388 domain-containing protein [Kofleriaceae bacterium]|nr:DUF4388 domain-containing protein [Kofleriaceae bacterium]
MAELSSSVLIVADPGRVGELAGALAEPLPAPHGELDVTLSTGGDDTIDVFASRRPPVVVITASLELGDARSLVGTLREMAPHGGVAIVLVGDDDGPIRNAIDALELAPERFVSRPLAEKALRFAVQSSLDLVALRGGNGVDRDGGDGGDAGAFHPARTRTDKGTGVGVTGPIPLVTDAGVPSEIGDDPTEARAAQRARWSALADALDSVGGGDDGDDRDADAIIEESDVEPEPLPPPIMIQPRGEYDRVTPVPWQPGTTQVPAREPTLILREPPGMPSVATQPDVEAVPSIARSRTSSEPPQNLDIIQRGSEDDEEWSQPIALRELVERADAPDPARTETNTDADDDDDDDHGDADDDDVTTATRDPFAVDAVENTPPPLVRGQQVEVIAAGLAEPSLPPLEDLPPLAPAPASSQPSVSGTTAAPPAERPAGRDFARRLREKMSQMAARLFQDGAPSPTPVDVRPRHDHQTEIDLAALVAEPALGSSGATEIDRRRFTDVRELTTSPGSWDTQVRERGLPDSGEIVRGVSDAAMLLAKLFATTATGRIGFRRDDVEKVVYFDAGRPVFASSNERGDRMGELLVREGKITAAQYERCQVHVEQSGRRMGEILVDFGYLKRRELLPAVRRHVEDIIYSLFGWDHGHYHITPDQTASGERIRLSRHPASLILEGVRRKLDRSTLEKLVGAPSTVVEVRDRERLGGVVSSGDLGQEERIALTGFDGQADLTAVARAAGADVADILPLAWGLCVLGLAALRRADAELEEATALVGETDLAIDRERVRARWQLVTEADYFALLGVRREATGFEIRRAYQAARRDFASDGFPPDLRRELARELDDIAVVLDEAFRVLRDDRLRGTYLANLVD